MGSDHDRSLLPRSHVTTTDLLKFTGLVFVLVDHVGLFFDEEQLWWRVVGRVAAPIFFFLIGFAKTRRVPASWLWIGAGLTALDVLTSGGLSEFKLNLLFSFAALRLALPVIEHEILPRPARFALLLLLTLASIRFVDPWLEYGMEGWLWAYFGLALRVAREDVSSDVAGVRTLLLGALAASAYVVTERMDFSLTFGQTSVLAVLMASLFLILLGFRRRPAPWQPAGRLAWPFRFAGRHSIAIYAVSLALMQIGGAVRDRLAA